MQEHHYLGLGRLIGESLRYIAIYQDQWLALLGWASAALHCGARDKIIGWTAALRQQRLQLIANNVRFFILPDIHITNLASRILGLNVRRLSKDWIASLLKNTASLLALDGKALKGAVDLDGSQLQLLSVFDHEQRVIVAQSEVGFKKKKSMKTHCYTQPTAPKNPLL